MIQLSTPSDSDAPVTAALAGLPPLSHVLLLLAVVETILRLFSCAESSSCV